MSLNWTKTFKPGKDEDEQPDLVQKYFKDQANGNVPTTPLVTEIEVKRDGGKFKAKGVFEKGFVPQSAVAESDQNMEDAIRKLIEMLRAGFECQKSRVKATNSPRKPVPSQKSRVKATYRPENRVRDKPDLVQKYFKDHANGSIPTTPFVTKIVVEGDGGKFEAKGVFEKGFVPQSAVAESDQNMEDAIRKLIEMLRAGFEAKPRALRAIRSANEQTDNVHH